MPKLYDLISHCFIYKNLNSNRLSLEMKQWICGNCSNHNFCKFIGNKQENKLSICTLCGIEQNQSIILRLRKHDTFIMIKRKDGDSDD